MGEWLTRLKQKPWFAHLMRAIERYGARLGGGFAAAITYFSVLALVPIAMLAFSIIGFVLTNFRPDLIGTVVDAVTGSVGGIDPSTRETFVALVGGALRDYTSIGIVGLISALYSGAGWMGNLRNAVRAQWRPAFDLQDNGDNILKKTVVNLVLLLGLILGMAVTFALASLSTSLSDTVVDALGLSQVGWLSPVLRIAPIAVSVGAGWLVFMYLYAVLPETREPWPVVRRGALIGAIGLIVLQYLSTFLISRFAGNAAAGLFGPVIVVMLFFNLFAQLVLFVAAWIATAEHEAVELPEVEQRVRFALTPEGEAEPEATLVSREVAARTVRVGMGAGYVTGAATGVGLGAALAYLFSSAVRGRRKS